MELLLSLDPGAPKARLNRSNSRSEEKEITTGINTETAQGQVAQILRPKLSFETITFSDGTTLQIAEDDIVVFGGPNNAGKSAALRELEAWVARSTPGVVVKQASLRKVGTSSDLRA
jgi:ATPase subunit of ABC transporter with duplicated ATPase domains